MSNKLRKQDCARARGQKHRDKRRDKREAARSHHKETPRSQRSRSNVIQFPTWALPVRQWSRKVAA